MNFENRDNPEFNLLARQAFEVMMQRGWSTVKVPAGWAAVQAGLHLGGYLPLPSGYWEIFPDPFTALIEADNWYKEKMKKP